MEEKNYVNSYICSTRVTSGRQRSHFLSYAGKTWYPVQPGDIGRKKFEIKKLTNTKTGQVITLYS